MTMNASGPAPYPDYTPEQKTAIYAKYKKLFTVEDLIGYIENDEPTIPAEQVMAEVDAIVAAYEIKRGKVPA